MQDTQIDTLVWISHRFLKFTLSLSNLLIVPSALVQNLIVSVFFLPINVVASQIPRTEHHSIFLNPFLSSVHTYSISLKLQSLFEPAICFWSPLPSLGRAPLFHLHCLQLEL